MQMMFIRIANKLVLGYRYSVLVSSPLDVHNSFLHTGFAHFSNYANFNFMHDEVLNPMMYTLPSIKI